MAIVSQYFTLQLYHIIIYPIHDLIADSTEMVNILTHIFAKNAKLTDIETTCTDTTLTDKTPTIALSGTKTPNPNPTNPQTPTTKTTTYVVSTPQKSLGTRAILGSQKPNEQYCGERMT